MMSKDNQEIRRVKKMNEDIVQDKYWELREKKNILKMYLIKNIKMKLTEEDRKEREALVKDYNRARRKDSKSISYEKLMEFEDRMLSEDKSG